MDAKEVCEAFNAAVHGAPDEEVLPAVLGKSSVVPNAGNSPNITLDYQKLAYQAQAAGDHLAAMRYRQMHNELSKP